jgi:hypothetical protein
MLTKKQNTIFAALILVPVFFLAVLKERIFDVNFLYYNRFLFESLFIIFVSYLLSSLLLISFSDLIFKKWLKRIVVWYMPTSLFLVWASDSNNFFDPGEMFVSIFLGVVFFLTTLVFAVVQRFYHKC